MRLLIDAGNTRIKWQVADGVDPVDQGAGLQAGEDWLTALQPWGQKISRVAVSTVISEEQRKLLECRLANITSAPVFFYWSEASRGGLVSAYQNVQTMGADRWHAMYGAWRIAENGFAVVDAGSAITVDYVQGSGQHLGGYILSGKQMMLRSLRQDAARIGFDTLDASAADPGKSTTECVQHGVVWLFESMIERVKNDCERLSLDTVFITGGDGQSLNRLGLSGRYLPDLVLQGVAMIDSEQFS